MKSFVLGSAVLAVLLGMAGTAQAAIIVLTPTSDRDAGDSNGNGILDNLRPETNTALIAATSGFSQSPWRFAAEFNGVSGVQVLSAQFSFRWIVAVGPPSVWDFLVHGYAADGSVSLSDLAGVNNPIAGPLSLPIATPNVDVDVTAFVQTQVGSGQSLGFMVQVVSSNGFSVHSKESSPSLGPRPRLLPRTRRPFPSRPA
jgi:hypothetical protein